jgi:hypothetical protein
VSEGVRSYDIRTFYTLFYDIGGVLLDSKLLEVLLDLVHDGFADTSVVPGL